MGKVSSTDENPSSPEQPEHQPRHTAASPRARAGQRGRIVTPRPPAPVPEPRKKPTQQSGPDLSALSERPRADRSGEQGARGSTETSADRASSSTTTATTVKPNQGQGGSEDTSSQAGTSDGEDKPPTSTDTEVVRAGGTMAVATLLSRITGFFRNLLIGSTMGAGVASAYTSANTLPNLITEIVLGAILTSLVIPVLVRAEKEDADHGAAFIRRLLTVASALLVGVTVLAVLGAPWLVQLSLDANGKVNVTMATVFAYLLLPQILFYGLFALLMAVLNTKGIFGPGAWAPVINNVIVLVVLLAYWFLPGSLDPTQHVTITDPHILLLGAGTTVGVVVQALMLFPYLRMAGVDLRPLWGIDDRVKQFAGMGLAIVVYVAISQAGYFFTNRIASAADPGALFIYQQHWLLLQVPYGVIGVTLLTAIMPRLSRNAADGDNQGVVRDLTMATKITLMALIPVIVYFTVFGTTISSALFAWGRFDATSAETLGWTLSFGAFTLVPYSIVLLHLRVFYAREQAWTPTFIIIAITLTKVILSYLAPFLATRSDFVVVLLAAANGFGFITGAIVGAVLLHRSLGSLRGREVMRSTTWVLAASLAGALAGWLLDLVLRGDWLMQFPKLATLIRTGLDGIVLVAVAGLILAKSGLEEIAIFGRALARIPGLRRFVSVRQSAPEDMVGVPNAADAADTYNVTALSTASPGLPPMSAGFVRGPKLVPGAAVANGRYRLLADHGGTNAMRLWHAREQASGREFALTIIDTMRIPGIDDYRTARDTTDRIIDRTSALYEAKCAGLAQIRHIIRDSAGAIVVADWTPGSALAAVGQGRPDPYAAAFACAGLAEATVTAHRLDTALGIDHRDRLRISSSGEAVLAFPGVMPHNSYGQDVHGVGVALSLLLENVNPVPTEIAELQDEALHARSADAETLADRLRRTGLGDAELHAADESTPNPEARPGFGEASRRPTGIAGIGALAIVVVLAAALVATYVVGKINRSDNGPLNSGSLGRAGSSITQGDGAKAITPTAAAYWAPENGRGTPDNPDMVPLVIDGNGTTEWRSDEYQAQLGSSATSVKSGMGIMMTLPEPATVTSLRIDGAKSGTHVEIRAAGSATPATVDETTELASADLEDGSTTIDIPKAARQSAAPGAEGSASTVPAHTQYVLVWITALPVPDAAEISEIGVTGVVDKPQSSTVKPTSARSMARAAAHAVA